MSIYAIADLHLSYGTNKPMNIFGNVWEDYEEKLKQNWISKITDLDTVLLPGDFSWGINLEESLKDFEFINKLPGRKILLKGNHDYWWTTLKKMNKFIADNGLKNIEFLYNNAIECEDYVIIGTRGWTFLENEENNKIIARELIRLENSIQAGKKLYGNEKEMICIMHYPPVVKGNLDTSKFIDLMNKYNIKKCFYGHLHGYSHEERIEGLVNGIELKLISSDFIKFDPVKII